MTACVGAGAVQVYAQAKHGADWWAANLFRHKTYVEARSVANPFIAFWRVYAFHAVLLTAMASLVSSPCRTQQTRSKRWL